MDIRNFVLSYYSNSTKDFHIRLVDSGGAAQKPHTHAYFQIYFMLHGSLTHYVGDRAARLTHGDMTIVPPGTPHHIERSPDAVFYSLSFMPELLSAFGEQFRLAKDFLNGLQSGEAGEPVRARIKLPPEEAFHTEELLAHTLQEFEKKPLGYAETIRAYTALVVTLLARACFEKERETMPERLEGGNRFVLHCMQYVENNFSEPISLEEICRRSAMSRTDFCARFRALTGQTFNGYLNACRVKKAAEWLREGRPVSAVSDLCGYRTFSTFYRNFKKIMGVSPREYRAESV